ncbi:MAG: hypothetical protein JWR18_2535 [Segetibacter sp.]|jgi:hypothetical protein|nr:hypothetical protein [Segetibacter sp.]
MFTNNCYESVEGLDDKVSSLKQQLQETELRYNEALSKVSNEEEIYELGLDIQNLRRKQECFIKLLHDKQLEVSLNIPDSHGEQKL